MTCNMFHVGDIVDDMIITETPKKGKKGYKVQCRICGRQKNMRGNRIHSHIGTEHKQCGRIGNLPKSHPRFYRIWNGIRERTTNPRCRSYKNYGARGISSEEFKNFIDFFDAMYSAYEKAIEKYSNEDDITVERKDVNGNYTKDNCIWIPLRQQAQNTTKTLHFIAQDSCKHIYVVKSLVQFARQYNLDVTSVYQCLQHKAYTHKNWIFYHKDDPQDYIDMLNVKQNKLLQMIIAISPDNVTSHFPYCELMTFCNEHLLQRQSVIRCLNNIYGQYKGWHFSYVKEV